MTRYVIIGCSAAGLAAAKEIRKADPDAGVTVISREADPFYFRPELIEYLLTGEKAALASDGERLIERFELELKSGSKVTAVEIGRTLYPVVRFEDGETLLFDYLVAATGKHRSLGLLRRWNEIPLTCEDMASAERLRQEVQGWDSAIVCGGGIEAIQLLTALKVMHKKVTFITDDFHFTQPTFGAPDRERTEALLARIGVKPVFVRDIVELTGDNGGEIVLTDEAGRRWSARGLIAAYPRKPNVDWLRGAGVVIGEGIKVTADLQSTAPNIFAAGDCAEVLNPVGGESLFNYGWRSAARQGEIAGRNVVTVANGGTPDQFIAANTAFFNDRIGRR